MEYSIARDINKNVFTIKGISSCSRLNSLISITIKYRVLTGFMKL